MLKVKIEIEDTNGKNACIEINEADNLTKLVIIQNVFKLFNIDTDIMTMVNDYNKIGKAYSNFFNKVNPIETSKENAESVSESIKEQYIDALKENKAEIEETYKTTLDQPDFVRSGIKTDPDGKKRYRLHYKCVACYNRGSHYINENSKITWCHRCQHEMTVYPSTPDGFPNQDTFGNFYRAGDFQDWNFTWK